MALHVNFGLLEEDCCRTAFLRGAFLAGGSVTDPEKRYHMELATSHQQASREVSALLTEMGFLPRRDRRGGSGHRYRRGGGAEILSLLLGGIQTTGR